MDEASLWRNRSFVSLLGSRMASGLATQIQAVAVGWHIYALTHDPMALGMVGLAVFVPMALLALPAGDLIDRFSRRRLMALGVSLQGVTALCLFLLSADRVEVVWLYYLALTLMGLGRAFAAPAYQALVPQIVAPTHLSRAVAMTSSAFQGATIVGPALGGVLYIFGAAMTFALCLGLFVIAVLAILSISGPLAAPQSSHKLKAWARLRAGVGYVRQNKVVLGALSMDMVAVLLGGATALLPVYARDILHVGPQGLGVLRAAPAVGALIVGICLGRWPIERHTGRWLFTCVALFGAGTVVFGLSHQIVLSCACLLVMGGADMVSMFVRQTVVQLATPDSMRGRVSAVNMLFISASNELGEFESGLTAGWFGAVPAVVLGGMGTMAVVVLWAWWFPALRRIDRMTDVRPVNPAMPRSERRT